MEDGSSLSTVQTLINVLLCRLQAMLKEEEIMLSDVDSCLHDMCHVKDVVMALKKMSEKEISVSGVSSQLLCPLSKRIMCDPVLVLTTQPFEKMAIQEWLMDGHRTCQQAGDIYERFSFVPVPEVKLSIENLCTEKVILFNEALALSCVEEKIVAARELLSFVKRSLPIFPLLSVSNITPLFRALSSEEMQVELRELLVDLMYHLSLDDRNKKIFIEEEIAGSSVIRCLRSGNIETRKMIAVTISNIIGEDESSFFLKYVANNALDGLVVLLQEEESNSVAEDAIKAILKLLKCHLDKGLTLGGETIDVLLDLLSKEVAMQDILETLEWLSSKEAAIQFLVDREETVVHVLRGVLMKCKHGEAKARFCFCILSEMVSHGSGSAGFFLEEPGEH